MTRGSIIATDAQERAMLATVRSLHNTGFSVTAVATSRTAPGFWSRGPDRRRLTPDPRRDTDGFIAALETIVGKGTHDVLLAGTDASLLAVSCHRHRLEPYVSLGLPSHEIVERALDKEYVSREAAEVGLASPDALVCSGTREALAAAESFGYPILVKPVRTVVQEDGRARRCASVVAYGADVVRTAAELFETSIVQRRVNGTALSFGGVATEQGLLGFVVSRYTRTWPATGGNVSFSATIAPPVGLAEKVEALVGRLRWIGLFELELIGRESGEFSAIDFNPRAYGSLTLGVAAGVPLPALWCEWLLGGEPQAGSARIGVRYRWEDADLRHLGWCLRQGDARGALAVARPRRGVTHAYFQLRDPAPAIARGIQLVHLACERAKQRQRRLFRAM